MAPNNDDLFESHPSRLDTGFPAVQVDLAALGQLNTTNIPRTAADTSVLASDAMVPLTDAGTVVGDQTVPPSTQLQVLGPAIFDGTINARGAVQIAEPGSGFDEATKKRITIDKSASLVMRVDTTPAEAVRVIIGDFKQTSGTTTTKSDATQTGTLPVTATAGLNQWVQSTLFMENTLLSTDLPSYDGNFVVSGTIQALTSLASGSGYGGVQTRARVKYSIDGGANFIDAGTVGTVSNTGTTGTSTSKDFSGTFNFGTGTSIIVRVYAESYVRDIGSGGGGGTGGTQVL